MVSHTALPRICAGRRGDLVEPPGSGLPRPAWLTWSQDISRRHPSPRTGMRCVWAGRAARIRGPARRSESARTFPMPLSSNFRIAWRRPLSLGIVLSPLPSSKYLHFSEKKAGWTPRRRHDPPGAPLQEHAAVLLRDARARCHARAAGGPPEPPRSVRVISWPAVAAAGQAVRFRSAPRREGARAVEGSRDEPHNEARHRCGTASGRGACDGRGGRAFPQGHASPTRATAAAG